MFDHQLAYYYRWCFISEDKTGGGIVKAFGMAEASRKLSEKYPGSAFKIWPWTDDDYFDPEHNDIFNLY